MGSATRAIVAVFVCALALPSRTLGFAPHPACMLSRKSDVVYLSLRSSTDNDSVATNDRSQQSEKDTFSLPWTDFQAWALRDNILKYIISIPREGSDEPTVYALWRTMSREVIELSGYPVDTLQEKYKLQVTNDPGSSVSGCDSPGALPLLDEYEFQITGGLSGRVYGIPGVAEGTRIETTSVTQVQLTIPLGYVLTEDASVAYELGTPYREISYSLDGMDRSKIGSLASGVGQAAGDLVKGAMSPNMNSVPGDDMLVRLGASTAILLTGATALNMLSHHLTVNVFWV
ncbi:hypothetical protein MHU86_9816 [Fragilaria crotonensis]|nr:hypothetical protein MHU86_9816 [Fragilaria crotonensis]